MKAPANLRVLGLLAVLILPACGGNNDSNPPAGPTLPSVSLKDAKLLIEHNATDEDTGFQAFVDGEAWKELRLSRPDGQQVLQVTTQGSLGTLGLTELFFETQEPANAVVPIADVLAKLPAGTYAYKGTSMMGNPMTGSATLSHSIPMGPVLTAPAGGAIVNPTGGVVFSWQAVTQSLSGGAVTIAAYQLIVEKDVPAPFPNAFASLKLSVHLPASATSFTVSSSFFEAGTPYKWEVLAIEQNGNQTLSSSDFETQ